MTSKKIFTASQFTPTKWDTAENKAKFANHFVRFVRGDMAEILFPKWFYTKLSNTFGHIAHYNQHGFYDYFFRNEETRLDFLRQTINGGGYGDPAYTYSDVEKALKQWLRDSGEVERYRALRDAALETAERAQLARLQAKYPTERTTP